MKRTLTSFALLIIGALCASVYAGPRSRQQAMAIAQAKANSLGVTMLKSANRRKVASATSDEDSVANYYIFNNGNEKGWTIVSGDDRLVDVIGYSDEGSLDEEDLPDVVKDILGSFDRQAESLRTSGVNKVTRRRTGTQTKSAIGPLCTTKWDQYEPYSNATPVIAGKHAATCCVAVAFSQILYYLYYTQAGQDSTTFTSSIPAYTRQGYQVTDAKPGPRTYNWADMLPDYSGKDYTDAQADAIAKLMVDVGCALRVKYGNGGTASDSYFSSTTSSEYIKQYAINYFGLDASAVYTSVPASVDAYFTAVDKELNTYHPLHVAGNSHAFVCDGRDATGTYYHFNFGYDGRGNGFYSQDAYDGYANTIHYTTGLRIANDPATPATAVDKLRVIYNSAYATAALEPVGTTPGYYQEEYYDALETLLDKAKAAINGETSMSDADMISLGEQISSAEQKMLDYRSPYKPGTYYIKSFMETTEDVAMYANGTYVCYGPLNTSSNNYKWEIEYNEEANGYTIKNVGTGKYINSITASPYQVVNLGNSTVYCEVWPTNRIETENSRYNNNFWTVSYANSIRPITSTYRDDDHGYLSISNSNGKAGSTSGYLMGWQAFDDWDVWVPVPIDVSNIPKAVLENESMRLKTGETATNKLTTNSDGAVTYSSSDTNVATVDADGVVTAVGSGDATITVNIAETNDYAARSVSYTIEVNNNYPTITFAKSSVAVKVECAVSNPAITTSDGAITYTSSNPDIAAVNGSGVVTGVAVGRATIYVSSAKTADNAAASGSFVVSVSQNSDLNTKLANLVTEAEKLYTIEELDSVNEYMKTAGQTIVSTIGLITSADQFSSPYTETTEGSFANLLDGVASTFWHSAWSGGSVDPDYHYFDVKLNEANHSLLELSMTRRSNATSDHITKLRIQYSSNGTSYKEFGTVDLPYASKNETKTADFTIPRDCQYLRFYLAETTTGRGYGHMGEFQLYDVTITSDATELQKALYELGQEVATAKGVTYATTARINSLQEAIDKYKDCIATGIMNVTGGSLLDNQSIYSLQGVKRNSAVKGINIIGGKKVYVK